MASESTATASQLETNQIEKNAQEIFTSTMSPFCPGLLISDCPSGKATELKDEIRSELQAGKSTDEVRTELQVRFKSNLDARPPVEGFGSLIWIVPVVLLLVGAIVLISWVRGQIKGTR